MTTYLRRRHQATNAYGTTFWVNDHPVTRNDWPGASPVAMVADGRVWWSDEPPSSSFTRPNAHCPVCGATVFFYQSPYGGRVFFDELGPPWPKHPCTDNGNSVREAALYPERRPTWRNDWRLLRNLRLQLAAGGARLAARTETGSQVRLQIAAAALGRISRFAYLPIDDSAPAVLATLDPTTADAVEFRVLTTARARTLPRAERHRQLFEADYRRLPKSLRRRLGLPAFAKLRPDVVALWQHLSESRVTFVIPAYLEDTRAGSSPEQIAVQVARLLKKAFRVTRREGPELEARAFVLVRDHFCAGVESAIDRVFHRQRLGSRLSITFIDVSSGSAAAVVRDTVEYKVFTTAFDEEVPARDLVDKSALADLEAKLLDAASKSRIPTDLRRLAPSLRSGSLAGCAISFLVDNSGSMRGAKIRAAAIALVQLAGTLEAAGARVEVLGFTTKSWKGGQARDAWLRAGKPASPGRLADLRHLIYKPADQPMGCAGAAFAVMLREGLLKENVDGEALLWAYGRLRCIRAHRRMLVFLSDGAPVDDSTLSANGSDYLNQHLRRVIRWLERRPRFDLAAVGLGYHPRGTFTVAKITRKPDLLGSALAQLLRCVFVTKELSPHGRTPGRRDHSVTGASSGR